MTKARKWWMETETGGEIVIRVQGNTGPEPLRHNQTPKRKYSGVASCEPYEKDGQMLKIFFTDRIDNPRAFQLNAFSWNSSEFSRQFQPLLSNKNKFSEKLNDLVGSLQSSYTIVQVHREDDTVVNPMSTFEWELSGSEVPEIGDSVVHSTPARAPTRQTKRTNSASIDDLPVLFKKKKLEMSADLKIIEEVKEAYLGSARIQTAHLTLGIQLREIREAFVTELMDKMVEFPGHFYQPLCVIIDTLDDITHFKETNANGFHYKVIGGCHNYSAAERLSQMYPGQDVFKTRLCSIYSNTLSEEAILWLANRHNKVGEFRHSMSLKEKIQLCRNIFETSGMENEQWRTTVTAIFSPEETKGVIKLLIKLATLEEETYHLLQEVLCQHANGRLKGQNLSYKDITNGPDMKPYVLVSLPSLPSTAAKQVLSEVRDGTMTLPDLQKETKLLVKLQSVQRMFVDLMGIKSWEEATQQYPRAATREALEHFCRFNLRSTPPELKSFCQQLKLEASMELQCFKSINGAVCYPLLCDARELDSETLLEEVPCFTGATLVILDKPQDWQWTDVKTLANAITSVNIHYGIDNFTLAVISPVRDMCDVEKAIVETRHFNEPVSAFYMVDDHSNSNQNQLIDCVGSITIAMRGLKRPVSWKAGHHRNCIIVQKDLAFFHDGVPIDKNQKPIGLFQELVSALTYPKEWILDVCSGTGTGCLAALKEGRNVVGLESNKKMLEAITMRLSTQICEVGPKDNEIAEDEDSVDEDNVETLNLTLSTGV
ncbi:uncharacterized protein [Apostichopus japonicus]|uniref:uncharacterized protein isoform X1 n=1 Tax=Stichopus japonicus TaxID=307972 RepID=UPI003AB8BF63